MGIETWLLVLRRKDPQYLFLNFVCVVGLVFFNKFIFVRVHFPFAIALSVLHYTVTWLVLLFLRAFGVIEAHHGKPITGSFWLLTLCVGWGAPLNNVSLKLNSVGVYQVLKLLVIPLILMLEYWLSGKYVSIAKVLALSVMTFGICLATVTDLYFSWLGTIVAVLWTGVAAGYKVLWHRLENDEGWETFSLMFKIYPFATIATASLIPVLDPPGLVSHAITPKSFLLLFASGLVAFMVNWSGFLVIGRCSPMTHVLLGQLKSVVMMLGGYLFFNQGYRGITLFGCALATGGIIAYTHINLTETMAGGGPSRTKSDLIDSENRPCSPPVPDEK